MWDCSDLLAPLAHKRGEPVCGVGAIPLRKRDGTIRAFALVDAEDYEDLSEVTWRLLKGGSRDAVYAGRTTRMADGDWGHELIHRRLMGLTKGDGLEVDHIDGDPFNNRRQNLRVVTRQQQVQNLEARGGSSRHRGVTFDKATGRWKAQVGFQGGMKHIGRFDSEQEAADAARAWRRENLPFSNEERG